MRLRMQLRLLLPARRVPLFLLLLHSLFSLSLCAFSASSNHSFFTLPSPALDHFVQQIVSTFENQSRWQLVNQELERISTEIRVKPENADTALSRAHAGLSSLLSRRIRALRKLTEAAEKSVREYEEDISADDDELCNRYEPGIQAADVHRTTSQEDARAPGVHVNIESYQCDVNVIRDFNWTGSHDIERAMNENNEESEPPMNQFIGTYSGLTRLFPRRTWKIDPPLITIDLFDPRFRPWFVNAEAPPKDVVFLLDFSGSVKGPTMHLMRMTLLNILATLSPNDYFSAIAFSHNFSPILPCANHSFIPATTRNKRVFYHAVLDIEEKEMASLGPPLKLSLQLLRQKVDDVPWGHTRSGGHKIILLMTDGIDEWPRDVVEEEIQNNQGDLVSREGWKEVRVFGLAMGFGTGRLPLLQWLACQSKGADAVVDSISDVKIHSRTLLNLLSGVHADNLRDIPIDNRPISWTSLYMETQGGGPVVTLSTPVILTTTNPAWTTNSSMAGISGIDIHIKELTEHLPRGQQLSGFIVDNNGNILYHERHIHPKTEVHSVRRSACYDSTHTRTRSSSGLRVQYGLSDQRVYRLLGLLDSIPTIDMYDLEGNSSLVQRLRNTIMTEKCDGRRLEDSQSDRTYLCRQIAGSPYTVVIIDHANRASLEINQQGDFLKVPLIDNPLVHFFLARRSICKWTLDGVSANERYMAWLDIPEEKCPMEERLERALAKTLYPWASSWHPPVDNKTCEEANFPGLEYDARYYINSFVYTRGSTAAYYPSCTWPSMKEAVRKMERERFVSAASTNIHVSVRNDILIAYRPMQDDKGNRLAVVGVQWRGDFIQSLLQEALAKYPRWKEDLKQLDAMVVTKSGFVVASTVNGGNIPSHLADLDPQMLTTLKNKKYIKTKMYSDSQSECLATRTSVFPSSPSAKATGFLQTIRLLLTSLVSFIMTLEAPATMASLFLVPLGSSQPQRALNRPEQSGLSWNDGYCKFRKFTPYERCTLQYTHHGLETNYTNQFQLDGYSKCPRFARILPVSQTTMIFILMDKPCPNYVSKIPHNRKPRILRGCEIVESLPRRRNSFHFSTTSKREVYPACQSTRTTLTTAISSVFTFILLTFWCK